MPRRGGSRRRCKLQRASCTGSGRLRRAPRRRLLGSGGRARMEDLRHLRVRIWQSLLPIASARCPVAPPPAPDRSREPKAAHMYYCRIPRAHVQAACKGVQRAPDPHSRSRASAEVTLGRVCGGARAMPLPSRSSNGATPYERFGCTRSPGSRRRSRGQAQYVYVTRHAVHRGHRQIDHAHGCPRRAGR